MNVLILGSGGREHAFAWKIAQSPLLNELYVAPGNAGTASLAKNIVLDLSNFDEIGKFSLEKSISLILVGPEAPLVSGIVDYFSSKPEYNQVTVIGPTAKGAELEGSKNFAKEFMIKNNIPTATYKKFDRSNIDEADAFLKSLEAPYVLKADGLAAGKGVVILDNINEAKIELEEMILHDKFGAASQQVVIEEFLKGIELSVFVLTDGENYVILPEAKDYKRIGEGDVGLNTGGMGAISPVHFADAEFMNRVEERVIKPTIQGFKNDNITYQGFVFIGLMNVNGAPFVIEYNVRMGDPETEVVIPRIKSDFLQTLKAVGSLELKNHKLEITDEFAATVIMVSGGYPEFYEKGKEISGIESVNESIVFHAGTKKGQNKILTNGGRVLAITSYGNSLEEALKKSYNSLDKITFEKSYSRSDIGFDLVSIET